MIPPAVMKTTKMKTRKVKVAMTLVMVSRVTDRMKRVTVQMGPETGMEKVLLPGAMAQMVMVPVLLERVLRAVQVMMAQQQVQSLVAPLKVVLAVMVKEARRHNGLVPQRPIQAIQVVQAARKTRIHQKA